MFIQARLLNGFSETLLYKIPLDWNLNNLIGKVIKVPLRKKKVLAIVESIVPAFQTKFEIKFAYSIESFPQDKTYLEFINKLAYYYQINSVDLIERLQQFILKQKLTEDFYQNTDNQLNKNIEVNLTDEQQAVYNFLTPKISQSKYVATLLHGVTGSGKTEVYKKLIIHTINEKKSIVLLFPEVSLALQFEQLLKKSLPNNIKIFSFHSAVLINEKKLLWQSLLNNEPILILGVHLPVLLPINNLGLIIVDEEHDVGYQEKKNPRINSKEAAILKANLNNIPILLGSATPSISSLFNVKKRNWAFFQLKNRFSGSFPKIEMDFLNNKKQRKNFWISNKLENAIKKNLEKKEQTIIFLNRRGYSFFVQCKNCSFIFKCISCSVSLTLHKNNCLYCHYCGFERQYPQFCTECKTTDFLKKGIGTEQVVTILENLFPHAKIARADLDSSSKKKQWNKLVEDFKKGDLDMLVGTQTITKGYHFPNVTLVGILWADLNLHFPIYNATEITLQQLIQVAGRAGRQNNHSNVIVQTMMEHKIYKYLNEIDYLKFFDEEIIERENILYPPFTRFAEIEIKNTDEVKLEIEAKKLQKFLFSKNVNNIEILGPVKPVVSKIKNVFMQKIYLKSNDINEIINLFQKIDKKNYESRIYFTPNPTT